MSTERPNILLLFTDQQRFDTIAAAGYPHMITPNLDRLANEGCLYENAYTPCPICVPARYSLLTGSTEATHRIVDNSTGDMRVDGVATIPQVLSDHGYFTAAIGKMHFTPTRRHHGFLEMHLMEEIPRHRADDAYAEWLAAEGMEDVRALHGCRPLLYHEPQRASVDWQHHGSSWVAQRTIEVMRRNAGRRPFYIHAGWVKPHPPWNIPVQWHGLYRDADIPHPIPGPRIRPLHEEPSDWFGDSETPGATRAIREAYFTSISMIDEAVGRIIEHLRESGELDRTLILFTSDHGEMLGDHQLYQKMQPYEQSSHVPFIARWPEMIEAGSRERRFIDLLDIMPTALDAAGIDASTVRSARPYRPAGSSILRLDEGRDRTVQRTSFGRPKNRWVMLRDHRYKYVHFAAGGHEWFFDLQDDPEERRNLVGTDDLPKEQFHRLKTRCMNEEMRLGPAGAVSEGEFVTWHRGAHREPSLTGKFPGWANNQMPMLGDGTADEEARLLASEIRAAVDPGRTGFTGSAEIESTWTEHFCKNLVERGVGHETIEEIRAILRIIKPEDDE